MTGATGAVFSVELLRRLRNEPDVEIHLVLSPWARTTIHLETRLSAREVAARAVARPPTVMILIRSPGPARRDVSMVVDVGSGRVADRRQPAATGLGRGGLLLTAALGQPARVVRPPGACAVSACRSHSCGSAGHSLATWYLAFSFPGGVNIAATCPLVVSTDRDRPLSH